MIAPAEEGIHSVELGNAMLLSGLTGTTISLPIDSAEYAQQLQRLIDNATLRKPTSSAGARGALQDDVDQ